MVAQFGDVWDEEPFSPALPDPTYCSGQRRKPRFKLVPRARAPGPASASTPASTPSHLAAWRARQKATDVDSSESENEFMNSDSDYSYNSESDLLEILPMYE